MIRERLLGAGVLLSLAIGSRGATFTADTLNLSTVTAQTSSAGIFISSYVYVALNSSVTLQGSQGIVTSGSSVTASAFFGDGSNLTGLISTRSTQTFSGAVTFTSSFTVQSEGRQIILSTSSSVNNISISTIGAISFFPELHNTSSTVIPNMSVAGSSLAVCVAGSTLTITTSGGRVELSFTGTADGLGNPRQISFLQDGQFVNDLSTSLPIALNDNQATTAMPFSYIIDAPTPGVHSYCITANYASIRNDNSVSNEFYVKEIK